MGTFFLVLYLAAVFYSLLFLFSAYDWEMKSRRLVLIVLMALVLMPIWVRWALVVAEIDEFDRQHKAGATSR